MSTTEFQVTGQSQFNQSDRLQTVAEWLLLALVFTSYTRLSDALIKEYGLFSIAEVAIALLAFVLVVRWLTIPAPTAPARVSMPILLLVIYGLLAFASLLYAEDTERAMMAIEDYAKDAFIVVLVLISLRRSSMLRLVIWVLLAAGLLMGGLSLYQQLAGNFDQNVLGLAEANMQQIVGQTNGFRIAGPVGDPNFFAQIMLVLVPLALDRLWHEKKIALRALAALVLVVSLLTIVFTFSRGAFIGLLVVFGAIFLYYRPRPTAIILALLLVIPFLSLVPRAYMQRLETLTKVLPWSTETPRELALRGRLSEVTVGWLMFRDHPLAGVGLNNYPTHYLDYSSTVGLDPRLEARSAHSLYLQIASETGIIGILLFGAILWLTFRGLLRAPAESSPRRW